jgi:hypothetical protein
MKNEIDQIKDICQKISFTNLTDSKKNELNQSLDYHSENLRRSF